MNATHGENKSLRRVLNILKYLKQVEMQSHKEVFLLDYQEYTSIDSSLGDSDLLEMTVKRINEYGKERVKAKVRLTEVVDGSISNPGTGYVSNLWLYVADPMELDALIDWVTQDIEAEAHKVFQFTLDNKRVLRLVGREAQKVNFRSDGKKYDLLKYLAEQKTFVPNKELDDMFGLSPAAVRGAVTKIRDAIASEFEIPRSALFENMKDDTGYRVMNVTLLEND